MTFEYSVVPAPRRGEKAKGVKTTDARFALALQHLMNDMAADGWEFQRAETLPCDERSGLTSTTTTFRNMLVFRRPQPAAATIAPAPTAKPAPTPAPESQPRQAETVTEAEPEVRIPSEINAPRPSEPESEV